MHTRAVISIIATLLATSQVATAQECSYVWGTGTCEEGKSVDGGATFQRATLEALAACFRDKYGSEYAIDGIPTPDFGNQGKAWGVYMNAENRVVQMAVGNLCYCKQTMLDNILDYVVDAATDHSTFRLYCGVNECGGGTVPAGMYVSASDSDGRGGGFERWEQCPDAPWTGPCPPGSELFPPCNQKRTPLIRPAVPAEELAALSA